MKKQVWKRIQKLRADLEAAEAFYATLPDDEATPRRRIVNQRAPVAPVASVTPAPASTSAQAVNGTEYGKNIKTIRAMRDALPDTFDVKQVVAAMGGSESPLTQDQAAQALSKMGKRGQLVIVERGQGRKPSRYRFPDEIPQL